MCSVRKFALPGSVLCQEVCSARSQLRGVRRGRGGESALGARRERGRESALGCAKGTGGRVSFRVCKGNGGASQLRGREANVSQLWGARGGRGRESALGCAKGTGGGESALGVGVKLLLLSSFFFSGARRGKGGESALGRAKGEGDESASGCATGSFRVYKGDCETVAVVVFLFFGDAKGEGGRVSFRGCEGGMGASQLPGLRRGRGRVSFGVGCETVAVVVFLFFGGAKGEWGQVSFRGCEGGPVGRCPPNPPAVNTNHVERCIRSNRYSRTRVTVVREKE